MKILISALIALLLTGCTLTGVLSDNGMATIYYGMGSGVPSDQKTVLKGNPRTIPSGESYAVPFVGNTVVIYWVAEPITEPKKTVTNGGLFDEPIGDDQTFNVKTIWNWRIYYTTGTNQLKTTTFKIK